MKATLWTDGGARGNPGPAAFAYVLEADDGTVLEARGEAIGIGDEQRRRVLGARRRAAAERPRPASASWRCVPTPN